MALLGCGHARLHRAVRKTEAKAIFVLHTQICANAENRKNSSAAVTVRKILAFGAGGWPISRNLKIGFLRRV